MPMSEMYSYLKVRVHAGYELKLYNFSDTLETFYNKRVSGNPIIRNQIDIIRQHINFKYFLYKTRLWYCKRFAPFSTWVINYHIIYVKIVTCFKPLPPSPYVFSFLFFFLIDIRYCILFVQLIEWSKMQFTYQQRFSTFQRGKSK